VSDNISENRDGNPSIVTLIWRFFKSIKLALVLIIIVVVLSLVSIFLIQAPPGISHGSPEYTVWLENVVRPDFGIWTDTLSFFGLFDVFHSPLKHAGKIGIIARNPVEVVEAPKVKHREMRILSESEVHIFLEYARSTPYYALFYTALFTGMRRSELLAIRWSDVDLLLCQISVNRTLHQLRN
jgi:integrase